MEKQHQQEQEHHLNKKSARKAVFYILENGDMWVPVCDGLGSPGAGTLSTNKDPMDADSD